MERSSWTSRVRLLGLSLVAAAWVLHVLPLTVWGDEAAEKKGAALMDKFVEVTGGKAAHAALKSRVVKGKRILPGGETASFESYWVYPDKFRSIVELPEGTLERGSDGKTVWVSWPGDAMIAEGARRVEVLRESPGDRFGRWREVYQKAEYSGDEDVDGTPCSKVVLTFKPLDPKVVELPMTVFIAQDSGLIIKWVTEYAGENAGPEDNAVATIHVSDYRKVGKLLFAYQMKAAFQGEETIATSDEMVLNTEIPAEKFALPEAIKKQLNKK